MYGVVFEPFIVFTGTVWSPIVTRTHILKSQSYLGYQSLTTFSVLILHIMSTSIA